MKAFFDESIDLRSLEKYQQIELSGKKVFHLSSVFRIERGETFLLLNGSGHIGKVKVLEVRKNLLRGEVLVVYLQRPPFHDLSVLAGRVKKKAQEEMIEIVSSLGIDHLYFWDCEHAKKHPSFEKVNLKRQKSIIESSLIQSNNAYYPKVSYIDEISFLKEYHFDTAILSHPFTINHEQGPKKNDVLEAKKPYGKKLLLIIGPESGFSNTDIKIINETFHDHLQFLTLDTPILRSPLALSVCVGAITKIH